MITSLFLRNLMKFGLVNLNFLPNEELDDALNAENKELIIGAAFDNTNDQVVCCRADGVFLALARAVCENPHSPTQPDWSNVRPVDYGTAVAAGEFEIGHDFFFHHPEVKIFK